jgi:hypothetical protein
VDVVGDSLEPVGLRHVEVTRERRVQSLGALGGLVALPAMMLAPLAWLIPAFDRALLLAAAGTLLLPTMAVLASVSPWAIAWLMRTRASRRVRAVAAKGGLEIYEGEKLRWRVDWKDVGVAWARQRSMVELTTSGGDQAQLLFDTPADASQFVELVRSRPGRRRAYALALEGDVRRMTRKTVLSTLVTGLAAGVFALGPQAWPAAPIGLALTWIFARGTRRLKFGADGVHVQGVWRQRYVPYREIARVVLASTPFGARSLSLELESGERVRISYLLSPTRALLAKALLEEGMRMAENGAAAGAEVAALTRADGENSDAWKVRVAGAVRAADYRGQAVDVDRLLALMRNPAAQPAQRVAAALAVRSDPEGVARIRVAAEVSAEPDVREALEALAEEAIDERRVERALRKLEAPRR